jgi:hypothetical protein
MLTAWSPPSRPDARDCRLFVRIYEGCAAHRNAASVRAALIQRGTPPALVIASVTSHNGDRRVTANNAHSFSVEGDHQPEAEQTDSKHSMSLQLCISKQALSGTTPPRS